MRSAHDRSGFVTSAWAAVVTGTILAIASAIAGAHGGLGAGEGFPGLRAAAQFANGPDTEQAMLDEAIANLERQAEKLAAQPGPSCPDDFAALATGRPLRISMFYGYDEHDGRVLDRADAQAMSHVLTSPCRGELSACGFALGSRSQSTIRLLRTLRGRPVEVNLFTSSLAGETRRSMNFVAASLGQDRLSRSVKERFYRELIESDVVFYMGHSRLGGGLGFDKQSGVTTVVHAILPLPLLPVLEALRHRPTNLKILGMFSCDSNRYFRPAFESANPSLSLILTKGDINYGPAEQASLGALESVLSRHCGHAFRQSMISVDESDRSMTYLLRGR